MTPSNKKARVLFIEDEPGVWPIIIEDIVHPVQCEFDTKPNDGQILGWVTTHPNTVGNNYDLVICNLQHQRTKQNYGRLFIKELREHFPDLPIIVLSGMDFPDPQDIVVLMNELYVKYRVNYVALRRGDKSIDLEEFRTEFFKAVGYAPVGQTPPTPPPSPPLPSPGTPLPSSSPASIWETWGWKSSDGKITIPEGVIRDVLLGLDDILPYNMFCEEHRDHICNLAVADENRRLWSAVELWKALWLQEDGLPSLSLIEKLATGELSGEMYDGYRDHVAHSVWVYLLGLYLYNHNSPIREAVRSQFLEKDFLRAWKVAALFHDIGYICDRGVDNEDEDEFLGSVLQEFKRSVDFPLVQYLVSRKHKLTERQESTLAKNSGRHNPLTLTLDDIEDVPLPESEEPLLNLIEDLVIPTQLAQPGEKSPLRRYYDLAKSTDPKPKHLERFRDHGVLSALILLYQFHYFDYCLRILKDKSLGKVNRATRDQLEQMVSGPITQGYTEVVRQAAAAVGLHNVNVEIWDTDKASNKNLTLDDYRITLEENPLAFLLALTDVLQCWDRPKRQYVADPERLPARNQDVRFVCENDVIHWSVSTDSTAGRKLVNPSEEIATISKYMAYQGAKNLTPLIIEEEFS